MIPIGLTGFILFYLKYKKKIPLNLSIVRAAIIGAFIPSLDYIIKIISSIYFNSHQINSLYNIETPFFHSIFTIMTILLLSKIALEILAKEKEPSIYSAFMVGYFIYVLTESLIVSTYIFWPLTDTSLALSFKLIEFDIGEDFQKFSLFFITLNFLSFWLFGKLLNELILSGFLSRNFFSQINKHIIFQKKLLQISVFIGMLTFVNFYINKNLLLSIYVLLYIVSIIQFLKIVFNFNLEVKTARIN